MAGFIKWLAPQYDVIRARLRAEVAELRTQTTDSAHARTPEIVANLAVGLRYLIAFAVDCGAIKTKEEGNKLWQRGLSALQDAAATQAGHQLDAEPTSLFLRLLRGALASGRAHVASVKGGTPEESPSAWGWTLRTVGGLLHERDDWQPNGRLIGWIDGVNLYLEPEAAFAAAQQLAHDQGQHFPISSRTLRQRLNGMNLLVSVDETRQRLTVRRTLGGARPEVLHLLASCLVEIAATGTVLPSGKNVPAGEVSHENPTEIQQKPLEGAVGTVGTVVV